MTLSFTGGTLSKFACEFESCHAMFQAYKKRLLQLARLCMTCYLSTDSTVVVTIHVLPFLNTHTPIRLKGLLKILCILVALLGFVFFDVVYIVAVMNYAAQSEMNIHLLRATGTRIQQRIEYPDVNAAIKVLEKPASSQFSQRVGLGGGQNLVTLHCTYIYLL